MLEALRARNPIAAEQTMREHIEEPLRMLQAQAAAQPSPPRKTRTKHDGSRRRKRAPSAPRPASEGS
jgi:hypothetical protein